MRSTAVSISSGSGRVGGASSMSIGSSFPSAIAGGALRRVSTATCSSARGKPAYGLTSDRREAAALERILRGVREHGNGTHGVPVGNDFGAEEYEGHGRR